MVNSYKLKSSNGTVDLYGERPNEDSEIKKMVAEIKIIAPSFATKNIDGNSNIDQFNTEEVVKITEYHLEQVNPEVGSLLKDVKRLNSIEDNDIEKYMILVIPKYENSQIKPNLQKSLSSISISDNCRELFYPNDHFRVRIWKL
ncbi:hypothetical protein C942_03616 [Photobacterium marinum]|uniref:Uncharacterized protein n=2 Tax=Photobacterium marinum TaxID=1056511 RepID=L8J3Q1_9GAMM|nr:hypothetical protein C942_03616 [Photobacterium marinum]